MPAHASGNWSGGTQPGGGEVNWQDSTYFPLTDSMGMVVNAVNGNLVLDYTISTQPGIGDMNADVHVRYNSIERGAEGLYGYGWGMDVAGDVGLALANPASPVFVDESGHAWTFTQVGSSYVSPPGIDADLIQNGDGSFTLTFHDSQAKYQFDSTGHLLYVQDRSGNRNTVNYSSGLVGSLTNSEGQNTSFQYNGPLISTITSPEPLNTDFTYASTLDLANITPQDGTARAAQFAYDSSHDLTQITDRLNNITKISYVPGSYQVASVTQVTDKTAGTGPTWNFSYGSSSTQVIDPNGHATTYGYDSSGRVTSIQYPDATTEQFSWTGDNHLLADTLPSGAATTYSYDALNNLTGISYPAGEGESWKYANSSFPYNPSSYTDPQANTWTYGYNSQGLLNSETDPLGRTASTVYNSDGTPSTDTDFKGNVTSYSYDSSHRLTQTTYPSPLGAESYTYTGANWLKTDTDGKGQLTTFTYNDRAELTQIAYAGNKTISYTIDVDGNETALTDNTGTTSYSYNALNQVIQKTLPNTQTISYAWDGVDNLLSKTDQSGTTSYGYTVNDELASITDPLSAKSTFTYDVDGNLTQAAYPNGVTTSLTYDASAKLTKISATKSLGVPLTSYAYTYTNPTTNKPTSLRYTLTDTSLVGGPAVRTWTYQYDALNELTQATEVGAHQQTQGLFQYAYDANGNLTSESLNGVGKTLTYNAADELTQVTSLNSSSTYAYDANGNLTSFSGGSTFAYNGADQTTSVTPSGGSAVSMTYSDAGQGERVNRGSDSFQYDETGVSAWTPSGASNPTYFTTGPDGELVSERVPNNSGQYDQAHTYYYLYDGLGSVTGLTDNSGSLVNQYGYDPYGNSTLQTEGVANPFHFTGAIWDSQTNLYKMGERYYDPSVGRFTQTDPLGGTYLYADNNPVSEADPSGLCSMDYDTVTGECGGAPVPEEESGNGGGGETGGGKGKGGGGSGKGQTGGSGKPRSYFKSYNSKKTSRETTYRNDKAWRNSAGKGKKVRRATRRLHHTNDPNGPDHYHDRRHHNVHHQHPS